MGFIDKIDYNVAKFFHNIYIWGGNATNVIMEGISFLAEAGILFLLIGLGLALFKQTRKIGVTIILAVGFGFLCCYRCLCPFWGSGFGSSGSYGSCSLGYFFYYDVVCRSVYGYCKSFHHSIPNPFSVIFVPCAALTCKGHNAKSACKLILVFLALQHNGNRGCDGGYDFLVILQVNHRLCLFSGSGRLFNCGRKLCLLCRSFSGNIM